MNQHIDKSESKVLQLETKKRKLELQLAREKAKLKEKKRKARTKKLIEIGGLAEIADIGEMDRGALLGAMIQIRELLKDKPTFALLKQEGDRILKRNSS